jgi:hypothetical protein
MASDIVIRAVSETSGAVRGIDNLARANEKLAQSGNLAAEAEARFAGDADRALIASERLGGSLGTLSRAFLGARDATASDVASQADLARVTTDVNVKIAEQITLIDRERLATELASKAQMQFAGQSMVSQTAMGAAKANLTKTEQALTRMSAAGTPAIFKAATWSLFGIGGIAYAGIKQYMQFNQAITQSITQAGQDPKRFEFLSQTALDISKQTGAAINDVAASIYRVSSGTAGWNKGLGATKSQLKDIATQVSTLNVLGNVPGGAASEQSSRVITALLTANLKDVGRDPKKAGALLNATVGAGDIRMPELISAAGRGLFTSAKVVGASAKDTLAWLDLLTSFGTTGAVAGTYVNHALNLLAQPSKQGMMALGMIGIKPGEVQALMSGQGGIASAANFINQKMMQFMPVPNYPKYQGKTGREGALAWLQSQGINNVPQKLINDWISKGLTPQESQWIRSFMFVKTFGGAKQLVPIATLLNNVSQYEGIQGAMGAKNNQTAYNAAAARALNTPSQQMHKLLNTLKADLIGVGKAITPAFLVALKGLTLFVHLLTAFKPVLYALVSGIGILLLTAARAKGAELLKGSYSIMGSAYVMNDKIWKTLGKILPGKLGKYADLQIGRGGAAFRARYQEKADMAMVAAGKDILTGASMFGKWVTTLIEGEVMSGGGMGGGGGYGGGGGGALNGRVGKMSRGEVDSMLGGYIEDPRVKRLLQQRQRELIASELNPAQYKVLKYFGMGAYGPKKPTIGGIKKLLGVGTASAEEMLASISGLHTGGKLSAEAEAALARMNVNVRTGKGYQNIGTLGEGEATKSFAKYGYKDAAQEYLAASQSWPLSRKMPNLATTVGVAAEKSTLAATDGAGKEIATGFLKNIAGKLGGFGAKSLLTTGAEGLGSFLGGPVGMTVMMSLMPYAMSFAPKIIGSIGSFFGHMFGGSGGKPGGGGTLPKTPPPFIPKTLAGIQKKISDDTAKRQKLAEQILAEGGYDSVKQAQLLKLNNEISQYTGYVNSIKKTGYNPMADSASKEYRSMQAFSAWNKNVRGTAIYNIKTHGDAMGWDEKRVNQEIANWDKKNKNPIKLALQYGNMGGRWSSQRFAAIMASDKNFLLSNSADAKHFDASLYGSFGLDDAIKRGYGATAKQDAALQSLKDDPYSLNSINYLSGKSGIKAAEKRFTFLETGAMAAAMAYKTDIALSKDSSLGAVDQKKVAAAAAIELKKVQALNTAATTLAKNAHLDKDKTFMEGQKGLADALDTTYKKYSLTKADYVNAFAQAIAQSSSGLANLVGQDVANSIARNH